MANASPHRTDAYGSRGEAWTPGWVLGASAALLALGFGRKPGTPPRYAGARRRSATQRRGSDELGPAPRGTRPRDMRRADESGRGRGATTPSEIPARGWKDILVRVYREISDDRVLAIAAGVTFYVLLAIFPAIGALVSIYGLFADPQTIAEHLDNAASVLPGGAIEIVGEQVRRVAAQGDATLGLTLAVGLAVSLWSANAGMKALIDALNIVYDETEKRSFIKLNLISLTFTVGVIGFLLVALGAMVVLPVALEYIGLAGATETLIKVARWPVLFVVVALGLACIYRYGVSRDKPKWRWITWGSAVASFLWLVASLLFSWYAANFGSYNETYGSLGAAIGFMMWIWISTVVILLGAELDAEMEHQTARDTTEGGPRPLGQRGATMADTVGEATG
jgi:membrane protein